MLDRKRERTLELIRGITALGGKTRRGPRIPRAQQPDLVRVDYFRALRAYVSDAHEMLKSEVLDDARALVEASAERGRHDAGSTLTERFARAAQRYLDEQLAPTAVAAIAERYGKRTAAFQREQFNKQVRAAFGVKLDMLEPNLTARLSTFVEQNVSLIRSIPRDYFADVERRIFGGVRDGERWESIAKGLTERFEVAESKAKLIARDQVGKFYGEVNRARQEQLGLDAYIWRTVNDERVRDEHDARSGESFKWSDPPEDGHPGEAVQCRCYAEPDFTALLPSAR